MRRLMARSAALQTVLILLLVGLCAAPVQSQTAKTDKTEEAGSVLRGVGTDRVSDAIGSQDPVLAMGLPAYPVTPGDVYRIAFLAPGGPTEIAAIVHRDYTVNLGFLGSFSSAAMTFVQFQQEISKRIQSAYPQSNPEVILESVGRFSVHVSGAVRPTGFVTTTGLARLSDLVRDRMRADASFQVTRVTTTHSGAVIRSELDLFAALREGDPEHNPFLRPGDRITVSQASRLVRLRGEVVEPGSYALSPEDDIVDLVSRYGAGLLANGSRSGIEIQRTADGSLRFLRLDLDDPSSHVALEHGDIVTVSNALSRRPALQIQGAVNDPAGQIWQTFVPGQRLGEVLRPISGLISRTANLSAAQLFRSSQVDPVPVDLAAILYDTGNDADVEVQPGDRLLIPAGLLEVTLAGEVRDPGPVAAGSTATLAGLLADRLLPTASLRRVEVRYPNGETKEFDLFLARRFGNVDHNPLLQPGMEISVDRAERTVNLAGEVHRPGRYELLANDGIGELLSYYGGGATLDADLRSLRVERTATDTPTGRQLIHPAEHDWEATQLRDGDTVVVPSEAETLPVVVMQGAVTSDAIFGRLEFSLVPGDTLRSFVRRNRGEILPDADLRTVTLERRSNEVIVIDLRPLILGEPTASDDLELQAGDVLRIPFARRVVVVSGAVGRGGEFPYIPDRGWEYYVSLAGGIDRTAHWGTRPQLRDPDGNRLAKDAPVPPETRIHVPVNNPITLYLVPLGAVLSTVTAVIGFVNLISP